MSLSTSLLTNVFICLFALGAAVSLHAFFIAASVALARGRIARLEEMADGGVRGAARAARLLSEADTFLVCTQFGRVLASLATGLIVAVFALRMHQQLFGVASVGSLSDVWAGALFLYTFSTSAMLIVVQIMKAIAIQYPERVLCVCAVPLSVFYRVGSPIVFLVEGVVNRAIAALGVRAANEREVTISSAELGEIAKMSSEAGTLEHEEREILEGVAELSDRIARDVMTPRKDIVWIRDMVSTREVLDIFKAESVSRLLVCGVDLDDVRGVVLAKDLLAFAGESIDGASWRKFIRPAYRIPDTKDVKELLAELRQKQIHFSVVLNEHGEVVGVTTLEDLVEQIVGDIFDEFDNPQHELPAVARVNGELIVDGAVTISELESRFGISLPEGDYQTVGGFIHDQLGRVPNQGDAFSVSRVTISILEVQKHRVVRMSIRAVECQGADGKVGDTPWVAPMKVASSN